MGDRCLTPLTMAHIATSGPVFDRGGALLPAVYTCYRDRMSFLSHPSLTNGGTRRLRP